MNQYTHKINILHWNANGILSKIHEFYQHLHDNNIHVACLSETFLKPCARLPCDPDFVVHRLDRVNQSKGGVAIIVKREIKHQLLPNIATEIVENIGVKLHLANGQNITIVSCYLPGGTQNDSINTHFAHDIRKLTTLRGSYFICGDFNSKHRHWNCDRANKAGTILYDQYLCHNFLIEYPNEHTHFPSDSERRPSTIDLILTNGEHTIDDIKCTDMLSDHTAVMASVSAIATPMTANRRLQFDYAKTDWIKFQRIVNFHTRQAELNSELSTVEDIDDSVKNFTKLLTHARDKATPFAINNKYKLCIPDDLMQIIRYKNVVKNRWKRNRTPELKHEVNSLEAHIKREISIIRNINWSHKLAEIRPGNQSVWRTARFLKNGNKQIPPLNVNGAIKITSGEKATAIASQFAENHINPLSNNNANFTQKVKREVDTYCRHAQQVDISLTEIEETSLEEVADIIKCLPNNKAPGRDGIKNCLIKNLPPSGLKFIVRLINACLNLSYFPDQWKHADVIPIQKPQKDPTITASYRPISLLSSLSKLLERVVLKRLNSHIDETNFIPITQHGFRKGFSTVHQLNRVITHARQSLKNKMSTGIIALDVEKAFDRVWHNGVLHKMIKGNFPSYLIKLVRSFLANRTFRVVINGSASSSHPLSYGVPQGAVMSPCLYNIFTHDIPTNSKHETAQFADDVAKYATNRLCKPIVNSLNQAANSTKRYMRKWKIKVNGNKTKAMYITKRRTKQIPNTSLNIFDAGVEWENELKYLGVVIDKSLTFHAHINYVISRANTAIKVLYPLISRKSKLNVVNKIQVYKLAIRPILTYAMPALKGIAKTHINRLQITQNKALKTILNRAWYTPTKEVHNIANVPLICDYINRLSAKFENKVVELAVE